MTTGRFTVPDHGEVSSLLAGQHGARFALALAHGAGADMRHRFMESLASRLAEQGVATLRYQFPYTERGSRRPDRAPLLEATVRAAVAEAGRVFAGLPLFAGGKSMGGRMSSRAASSGDGLPVRGLVLFGFPLHPAGRRGVERADHLRSVPQPMLFLQGERDKLAELHLLRPICEELADRARLEVVPDANHGFHVPKRTGKTGEQVIADLARLTREWMEHVS